MYHDVEWGWSVCESVLVRELDRGGERSTRYSSTGV